MGVHARTIGKNFQHNSLHMVDAMFMTVAGCSGAEGAMYSDYLASM